MKIPVETLMPMSGKHSASVLFFHGSGLTESYMMDWVLFLLGRNMEFDHIKVVYPTAPLQPYTPNGGQLSNVWFDRRSINIAELESRKSLSKCYDLVNELIDNEVAEGIPIERIIVGGFSMGGAVALHTAYHLNPNVAGVFACSSFLNRDSIVYESLTNAANTQLPDLLMFHGARDLIVPLEWGKESFDELSKHGVKGTFTELPNALHELEQKEMVELEKWILQKLPPLKDDVEIQNKV